MDIIVNAFNNSYEYLPIFYNKIHFINIINICFLFFPVLILLRLLNGFKCTLLIVFIISIYYQFYFLFYSGLMITNFINLCCVKEYYLSSAILARTTDQMKPGSAFQSKTIK